MKRHVRETLDVLAPGGGFLFKLQALSRLFPPQNVLTAYPLARDYDGYRQAGPVKRANAA